MEADCEKGASCKDGECQGQKGQCSQDGCPCTKQDDCEKGALCNSRGFCTFEKSREQAQCSANAGLPKDKVIAAWKKLAETMVRFSEKKGVTVTGDPATDAAPLIAALKQAGAVGEKEAKALETLNALHRTALEDKDGTKITADKASRFQKLAEKLSALMR